MRRVRWQNAADRLERRRNIALTRRDGLKRRAVSSANKATRAVYSVASQIRRSVGQKTIRDNLGNN